MELSLRDQAIALMAHRRYDEALSLFRREIGYHPDDWQPRYMAGQCCRFLNDFAGAIAHLRSAVDLGADQAPVFLALGIAYQLQGQMPDAVGALVRAIEIDPDYDLAFNSLALTQKKAGDLEKALHNYEAGVMALGRKIVKAMHNSRSSPILKDRDTVGKLWLGHVFQAAIYLASSVDGVQGVAWPSGQMALEEANTKQHGGLYWTDTTFEDGVTARLYLPNFFNTFQDALRRDGAYSNLLGNRGAVLALLDRHDEAQLHLDEATEFMPEDHDPVQWRVTHC